MAITLNGTSGITTPTTSATGEFVTSVTGFKNRIINGAMNIWQRNATLSTNNTQGYYLDRMWGFGSSTVATYTQGSSSGLTGFPYFSRAQRTAGNTGTNGVFMGQIIESNNLQDLQGQSVTVSFWARAGANYSPVGNTLTVLLRTGTVADQGLNVLISGWTGAVTQTSNVTLTTSWQYFSKTFTVASNVQEIASFFEASTTGTAGANDYYDITGFQLEKGTTATSFDYRPYGQELINCQRYFTVLGGANYSPIGVGASYSSTTSYVNVPFPVAMRSAPTLGSFSNLIITDRQTYDLTVSAFPAIAAGVQGAHLQVTHGATATTNRPAMLNVGNSGAGFLQFTSEL